MVTLVRTRTKRKAEDLGDVADKMQKLTPRKGSKNVVLGEDLLYFFDEVEIHPRYKHELQLLGITSVEDVIARRDSFKDGTVEALRPMAQEQIYHFCLWYENFSKENDQAACWRNHFNGKCFDQFVHELKATAATEAATVAFQSKGSQVKQLYDHAVNMLHKGISGDLRNLSEEVVESLYDHVVQLTMEKLPGDCVAACQFDVAALIKKCCQAIFNLPTGDPYPAIQLIAGRTQSGKSHVKAVVLATCDLLFCPTIIITKGVAESKDLSRKIEGLLNQDQNPMRSFCRNARNENRNLVIPDTAARINKTAIPLVNALRNVEPLGKWCVIVDECDAMYRTSARNQQMEQAYDQLMGLQPALRIEISATPIPALLYLGGECGYTVEMLELGTSYDYCGVTQMVSPKDALGKDQYLRVSSTMERKEFKLGVPYNQAKMTLQLHDNDVLFPHEECKDKPFEFQATGFANLARVKSIPFTDSSVMGLYNNALSESGKENPEHQGVLLLDCTNNLVRTEGNIFQKAACIQNHYFHSGKKVVIVCVVGDGIYFRRPGFTNGRKITNRKTISEVLHQLDQEFGLGMPFFVFGFSKMKRCISYRSDARVPTHMVLNLGLGQSNESYVQAIGRATFNGLETVLAKNGFAHVTVLATENDFYMNQRYNNLVHDLAERLKAKKVSVKEALQDVDEKFKDSANYLRFSNRKTGQMQCLKQYLPEQDHHFSDPSDDESDSIPTDRADTTAQRVLMSYNYLVHVSQSSDSQSSENEGDDEILEDTKDLSDEDEVMTLKRKNAEGFTVTEIRAMYNGTYQQNGHSIKMGELNKILTQLKMEAQLEKKDNGRWRAKNWTKLERACQKHRGALTSLGDLVRSGPA